MATYLETIANVRSWSDRDSSVLSDALIKTFLGYAADQAYRTLRVPALEATLDFTVDTGDIISDTSNFGTEISMTVPSDLIEVIYIQKRGDGVVWNQKVDPRTFHDRFADKKNFNFYTRVGSNFLLHGRISLNDILEVHYYKRLSSVSATYAITPTNYLAQTSSLTTMTRRASNFTSSDSHLASLGKTSLFFAAGTASNDIDNLVPTVVKASSGTVDGVNYNVEAHMEPAYIANWLRDENERILLYGALYQAYDFLEEPENAARYRERFDEEIANLNIEEQKRQARGGNTSISFSGLGLI